MQKKLLSSSAFSLFFVICLPFQNVEEECTSHKNETKRTKKDCQKVGVQSG